MKRRPKGDGRYYVTGPRADNRTGSSVYEMESLALTYAMRDKMDGLETTHYVREVATDDVIAYAEVREGETSSDRESAVVVKRVKPD